MISLGFATVENIMYVVGADDLGISVAILRMFSAIPLHAACGVIMGYYVGMAKFKKDNYKYLLFKGLLLATFVHAIYNYFFIFRTSTIFIYVCINYSYLLFKKGIKQSC